MIHFHGTPLTPTADMAEAFVRRHAMVSFAHPQQMEIAAEVCQSVALDNGAFPAFMAQFCATNRTTAQERAALEGLKA